MGAETNVVCTLKKEAGDREKPGETGNSGNKVGSYLASFVSVISVSGCFLVLPTDMQLGDVTVDRYDKFIDKNEKFIYMFLRWLELAKLKVLLDERKQGMQFAAQGQRHIAD